MNLLQKVNSKVSSVNNYLNKYIESSQFEKNLKESLNNKNYGVSNSLLYDLSVSTYDVNYYKRVVNEVFKALQEKPNKWRRIYKGLRLCEYVMKNGCEYFICAVKEKETLIKRLTHFSYMEGMRDMGVGIREISSHIIKLLHDDSYLHKERTEAVKYNKIYTSISSSAFQNPKLSKTKSEPKKIKIVEDYTTRRIPETQNSNEQKARNILEEILEERNLINQYTSSLSLNQTRAFTTRHDKIDSRSNERARYGHGIQSSYSNKSSCSPSSYSRETSYSNKTKKSKHNDKKYSHKFHTDVDSDKKPESSSSDSSSSSESSSACSYSSISKHSESSSDSNDSCSSSVHSSTDSSSESSRTSGSSSDDSDKSKHKSESETESETETDSSGEERRHKNMGNRRKRH